MPVSRRTWSRMLLIAAVTLFLGVIVVPLFLFPSLIMYWIYARIHGIAF